MKNARYKADCVGFIAGILCFIDIFEDNAVIDAMDQRFISKSAEVDHCLNALILSLVYQIS